MKQLKECLCMILIGFKMSMPFVKLTFREKAFVLYHRYLCRLDEMKFSRNPYDIRIGARFARTVCYLEKREARSL